MVGLKDIIKDAIREVAQIEPQFLEITEEAGTLLIYFTPEVSRKKEHKIRSKLYKLLNRPLNSIEVISSPFPLPVVEYYTKFELVGTKAFIYRNQKVIKHGQIQHYEGIVSLGWDKSKRAYFIIEGIGEDYHSNLINISELSEEDYNILASPFALQIIIRSLQKGYPLQRAILKEDIFSVGYYVDSTEIIEQIKERAKDVLQVKDVKVICYLGDIEMEPSSRIIIFAYLENGDEILNETLSEKLKVLNRYLDNWGVEYRIVELYSDNFSKGKAIKVSYWIHNDKLIQKIYVW